METATELLFPSKQKDVRPKLKEVGAHREKWKAHYLKLTGLCSKYEHCNTPKRCKNAQKLEAWAHQQRRSYSSVSLPCHQATLLNEVESCWGK